MNHSVLDSDLSVTMSPLRKVLGLNAATSLLSGLAGAAAPGTIADLLGLRGSAAELAVRLVGIGLVLFAVDVALVAARSTERTLARNTLVVSGADIAWVAATVVVLATVELSGSGRLIAVVMGLGVAGLAALQLRLR